MSTVRSICSRAFALLLAFALSIGALQCAAAGTGDAGSPLACCQRNDDGGESNPTRPDAGFGPALSVCPGACPGTAVVQDHRAPARIVLPRAPEPAGELVSGRSLAPDPRPPRPLTAL